MTALYIFAGLFFAVQITCWTMEWLELADGRR